MDTARTAAGAGIATPAATRGPGFSATVNRRKSPSRLDDGGAAEAVSVDSDRDSSGERPQHVRSGRYVLLFIILLVPDVAGSMHPTAPSLHGHASSSRARLITSTWPGHVWLSTSDVMRIGQSAVVVLSYCAVSVEA